MEPPTVREVTGRLRKEGWRLVRTKGDHRIFQKENTIVSVPGAMGDHLRKGTYAQICKRVGW